MINQGRLIDIFLQAATINAVSGNEKPVADFVKSLSKNSLIEIKIDNSDLKSKSNTGNVICKYNGGGDLLLLAHMDTARPTAELKPKVLNDRIISDGNTVLGVDNRVGVSVLLYLIESISFNNNETKPFTVAFTTCEETTLNGSKYLEVDDNISRCFVFDSFLRPGNFISESCGAMGFKAIVNGRASHSGIAPEKGINSIEIMSKAISKIKQGRIDDDTTINIGKISGGSAVNVVPEKSTIEGEVRSFKIEKIGSYIGLIKNYLENESLMVGGKVEFQKDWDFKPYSIKPDSEIYKEIESVLKSVGLTPAPNISLGGSDANSLNAKGIPTINIGIGAQNPHSNDEFILIEDLIKTAQIAQQLIRRK